MSSEPGTSNKSADSQRLHASCAARAGAGILLLGRSGSGKSDLLLRLVERGFDLVADDRVELEDGWAAPPPELAGLIELRGLGILRMPHVSPVRLALVVALDDEAAAAMVPPQQSEHRRLPLPSRHRSLGVPMLRVEPAAASAAFRIEIALDCLQGRRSLLVGGLSNRLCS